MQSMQKTEKLQGALDLAKMKIVQLAPSPSCFIPNPIQRAGATHPAHPLRWHAVRLRRRSVRETRRERSTRTPLLICTTRSRAMPCRHLYLGGAEEGGGSGPPSGSHPYRPQHGIKKKVIPLTFSRGAGRCLRDGNFFLSRTAPQDRP